MRDNSVFRVIVVVTAVIAIFVGMIDVPKYQVLFLLAGACLIAYAIYARLNTSAEGTLAARLAVYQDFLAVVETMRDADPGADTNVLRSALQPLETRLRLLAPPGVYQAFLAVYQSGKTPAEFHQDQAFYKLIDRMADDLYPKQNLL